MSDAEIDVDMPEQQIPAPNEQPEDPLPPSEGVDEDPEEDEPDEVVEMKIKEIVPDAEVFNDAEAQAPPKKARAKRPISDKQRAHLAKIRVKAAEAKKAKSKAKPKSAKKVYEEKVEDEHEEVDELPLGSAKAGPEKIGSINLTPAELRQLQYEAIYGYDTHRKAEKAERKKKEALEAHEKKTYQAISRAVNRPVDDDGWGVCFQ